MKVADKADKVVNKAKAVTTLKKAAKTKSTGKIISEIRSSRDYYSVTQEQFSNKLLLSVEEESLTNVSTGVTLLSEKTLFLGQKLTVIQGDIATVGADAIVHPTNSNWNMTGSCGSAIREGAGQVTFR